MPSIGEIIPPKTGNDIESISSFVSITKRVSPTCTTSFSLNRCSIITPSTSEVTSVSTLSVAISTIGSSNITLSPTCFNHLVTVASVTLSPILGNLK